MTIVTTLKMNVRLKMVQTHALCRCHAGALLDLEPRPQGRRLLVAGLDEIDGRGDQT